MIAAGVLALHASVDLLNDYRDYMRGIDKGTARTKMSGGSGVLPEGLLRPEAVNRAGIICLCAGASIGAYYIYAHGIIIGVILGFAIASIYFYSTRIVDWGLGEFFVGVKGSLIVLGTYYIQAGHLGPEAALAGAATGSLSALVLFIASFPDHDADKAGGRRTLVIRCGLQRATRLYWLFPGMFAAMVLAGILGGYFPVHAAPLAGGHPPGRPRRMRPGRKVAPPRQALPGDAPHPRILPRLRSPAGPGISGPRRHSRHIRGRMNRSRRSVTSSFQSIEANSTTVPTPAASATRIPTYLSSKSCRNGTSTILLTDIIT